MAVTAILLACSAGFLYGVLGVAVLLGLRRAPHLGAASVAINASALLATVLIALATGATTDDLDPAELWPFLIIGLVVPGITQLLYVAAVDRVGAARTHVVLATSPLLAALLAVGLLGEAWNIALVAGTLLVVLGGMTLAWDRTRPAGFRAIGLVLAGATAIALGSRDTATRWALTESAGNPAVKAAAAIAAGVVVAILLSMARSQTRFSPGELRRAGVAFAASGALMAGSYVLAFEALDRGKVTVVSPIVGTYALWTVLISAVALRAAEAISKRLLLATALVVGGVALVTSFREQDVPVPVEAAVAAFRADATFVSKRALHPNPGVYVYETSGTESIDFLLGTTHEYPDRTAVTVRYTDCGFDERWVALDGRMTERRFCATDAGLELQSYAERHEFVGRLDEREYVCDEAGLYAPSRQAIGASWTFSCTTGETTESWQATVVGPEAVRVDGNEYESIHIRFRTTLAGRTNGVSEKDVWLRIGDHALMRELVINDNTTDAPLGQVRYREQYELALADREPRR